jgi:hypothetical protein
MHCGGSAGDFVENGFGAAEQLGSGAAQCHPASGSHQLRCAHFPLQTLDQVAQRGLAHVQLLRSTTEVQLSGHSNESLELSQLHPQSLTTLEVNRPDYPESTIAAIRNWLFFRSAHQCRLDSIR